MKKLLPVIVIITLIFASCAVDNEISNDVSLYNNVENQQTLEDDSGSEQERNEMIDLASLPIITTENVGQLKMVNYFLGHTTAPIPLFHPDGSRLATNSEDGTFRIWELKTGFEILRIKHNPNVFGLDINPEGDLIASGGSDKTIRIWDLETGEELMIIEGYQTGIGWQALDWSPDGKFIVGGSMAGVVRVWDAETGTEITVLNDHISEISGINFNSDGSLLATASYDDSIIIWDVPSFEKKMTFYAGNVDVGDAAFSPDGEYLGATIGDITIKENQMCLWEVGSGELEYCVEGNDPGWRGDISFSPDGSMIISSAGIVFDGKIHLYDTMTGELLMVLETENAGFSGAVFSLDGRLIAAGTLEGVVEIWGVGPLE